MVIPRQGEVWWAEMDHGRRPVLVVSRSEAIPAMNRLLVAPITRTQRHIPTEVSLDDFAGLAASCAASFDDLQPVRTALLTDRAGIIDSARSRICAALGAVADC